MAAALRTLCISAVCTMALQASPAGQTGAPAGQTASIEAVASDVSDLDLLLEKVGQPLKQEIAEYSQDGTFSSSLSTIIVPEQKTIIARSFSYSPETIRKPLTRTYAYAGGKILLKLGSSENYAPLEGMDRTRAITHFRKALAHANAGNLAAANSTALEQSAEASDDPAKSLYYIAGIKEAMGHSEGEFQLAFPLGDEFLEINGKRFPGSSDIRGLERYSSKTLAMTCKSETFSAEGFAIPKETTFKVQHIAGERIHVSTAAVSKLEGFGALVESANAGFYVFGIRPESPASRSGLREGDQICAIDGASLEGATREDVIPRMRHFTSGKLAILRGTENREIIIPGDGNPGSDRQ